MYHRRLPRRDAGHRLELLDRGPANGPHAGEVGQRRLLACRPNARDPVELSVGVGATPQFAVVRDGEAVGLVADALEQIQPRRIGRQDDGRRSPGHAAAATFFLGRLYESQGRSADALGMYGQYLAQAPGGVYAEQSTAGRMRVLAGNPKSRRAREAAEAYLRKFPGGVHAPFARRVLEGSSKP